MSLWWLGNLLIWLLGAATTIIVVISWVNAMGKWELALVEKRKGTESLKPWKRNALEAPPWIVLGALVVLIGLFANNVRLDREAYTMAKIANERAIAAANAAALSNAGLLNDEDAKKIAAKAPGEVKDNMLAAPMPMDTESIQHLTVGNAAKKVLEAKKAQQEAVDLLTKNTAFAAVANLIVTLLLVAVLAFSLAFFFSSKTTGDSTMGSTWLMYFLLFLSLGAGTAHQFGGVKVFREAPPKIEGTTH